MASTHIFCYTKMSSLKLAIGKQGRSTLKMPRPLHHYTNLTVIHACAPTGRSQEAIRPKQKVLPSLQRYKLVLDDLHEHKLGDYRRLHVMTALS